MASAPLIKKYSNLLPVTASTPTITLGEGDTPLVKSVKIGPRLGCELYFKLEGCNPTGSFKDRGMVVAIAKALEAGKRRIICASTGNTSASAAAYGARFGLQTDVLIPQGKISAGKLAQAQIHGARIVQVEGNFDKALSMVREAASVRTDLEVVNSINPNRIAGQTTAAFEICEALGDAPDVQSMPVGNAGNIVAYWRGYQTLSKTGKTSKLPVMHGFQAAGAAPIVTGKPVANPETFATAIRIGNPASWRGAEQARNQSGGSIASRTDDQIAHAYAELARLEGLFVEPASAISVAGLMGLSSTVELQNKTVVCILTGNGLKDPASATARVELKATKANPAHSGWLDELWPSTN